MEKLYKRNKKIIVVIRTILYSQFFAIEIMLFLKLCSFILLLQSFNIPFFQIWESISESIFAQGYNYSPSNCAYKWRNMRRAYKLCVQSAPAGVRPKKTCLLYDEFNNYIFQKQVHKHGSFSSQLFEQLVSDFILYISCCIFLAVFT